MHRLPTFTKKGTSFGEGLKRTRELVEREPRETRGNVAVVFMSDGEADFPEEEINDLRTRYAQDFVAFWTIGFGNKQFDVLKKMAECLIVCNGEFKKAIDAEELMG